MHTFWARVCPAVCVCARYTAAHAQPPGLSRTPLGRLALLCGRALPELHPLPSSLPPLCTSFLSLSCSAEKLPSLGVSVHFFPLFIFVSISLSSHNFSVIHADTTAHCVSVRDVNSLAMIKRILLSPIEWHNWIINPFCYCPKSILRLSRLLFFVFHIGTYPALSSSPLSSLSHTHPRCIFMQRCIFSFFTESVAADAAAAFLAVLVSPRLRISHNNINTNNNKDEDKDNTWCHFCTHLSFPAHRSIAPAAVAEVPLLLPIRLMFLSILRTLYYLPYPRRTRKAQQNPYVWIIFSWTPLIFTEHILAEGEWNSENECACLPHTCFTWCTLSASFLSPALLLFLCPHQSNTQADPLPSIFMLHRMLLR